MNPHELPASLLDRLEKARILRYAQATGWSQQRLLPGRFIILSHPSDDLKQLLIPDNPNADDYRQRMAEVIALLAETEQRDPVDVLSTILFAPADVVRFHLLGEDVRRGDLSFGQATRMIRGIRKSLLSAACSVNKLQPFYLQSDIRKAERVVDTWRLRQTEFGSFTFVVACPIDAKDEQQKPSTELPLARRTTTSFMRSIAWIGSTVDAGASDRDVESAHNAAGLSSNLCEALLDVEPEDKNATLAIGVQWAWSLRQTQDLMNLQPVTLRRDHFSFVSAVARTLRSQPPQEKPKRYVGSVRELKGAPNTNGDMQGEILMSLFVENTTLRVRADLPPPLYDKALGAHWKNHLVSVVGVLRPLRKGYQLDPILDIDPLNAHAHQS